MTSYIKITSPKIRHQNDVTFFSFSSSSLPGFAPSLDCLFIFIILSYKTNMTDKKFPLNRTKFQMYYFE